MITKLTATVTHAFAKPIALFAAIAKLFDGISLAAAVALTLTGMAMHWHLPRKRMSMEERVKDGKLTETEARRQLRFYGCCAPVATVLGVAVLVAVLFDFTP